MIGRRALATITTGNAFAVGVVLGSLLVFTALSHYQPNDSSKVTTVRFTENGYSPDKLFIEKGQTVRFVNDSQNHFWPASDVHPTHDLYPAFDPKRSLPPGAVWEFTFDTVGPWHFHDHLKAHNLGVVYVFDESIKNIDDLCMDSDAEQQYCVVNYLYKLVEREGEVRAMEALQQMQLEKRPRLWCHKLTHDIGHRAYAVHGDSIEQAEILVMCSGGFFHGIMEGLLSKTPDVEAAKAWCDEQALFYDPLYKGFQSRCAHGVGHGIGETRLAEFDNDWTQLKRLTEEASEECAVYAHNKLFEDVCISGVYSVTIDWIISTDQQLAHFHPDRPFDFCVDLRRESMIQECIWEFAQRLYSYHDDRASIFDRLAEYLDVSSFLETYGEWAAIAVGLQLGSIYINQDADGEAIEICRQEVGTIETGCLKGLIEGLIISDVWGNESPRVERFCRDQGFTPDEQAWCRDFALLRLQGLR